MHRGIRDLGFFHCAVLAILHSVPMRKPTWARTTQLRDLSSHGVATRAELREAKVTDSSLTARSAPGGPWQRLLPGVYLLYNGYPSPLQRSIAALAYCGPDSLLTGRAGLAAHGFGTHATSSEVHVLVPAGLHRASTSFVRTERTTRLPDAVVKGSIRVAPLVRCLADSTRATTTDAQCAQLITEVLQRGGTTLQALERELAEGPRRFGAISKRVARELRDNAHSVAELEAQKLYSASGLPPMAHNCDIFTAEGAFLGCADNWLDTIAFNWEIDSIAHHLSPAEHERTMARRTRMQNNGLVVLSHLPSEIRNYPERVLADLRAHIEIASSRPRPPVTMRPRGTGPRASA